VVFYVTEFFRWYFLDLVIFRCYETNFSKIKLDLVKFAQFIFAGQNNITEEVFCPAEREHRPAMGFLHNNE